MRGISCAAVVLALSVGVAHADRVSQVRAYTRAAAALFFAEDHCPGARINKTAMTIFRARVGINDTEEPFVDGDLPIQAAEVRKAFDRAGPSSWCAETRSQFGRAGSLAPGLLD